MVFVRGVGLRCKHRAETAAGVLVQIDHVSSFGVRFRLLGDRRREGGGAESAFVGVTADLLGALIFSPSGARLDAVTLSSSAGTRFGLGLGERQNFVVERVSGEQLLAFCLGGIDFR